MHNICIYIHVQGGPKSETTVFHYLEDLNNSAAQSFKFNSQQ